MTSNRGSGSNEARPIETSDSRLAIAEGALVPKVVGRLGHWTGLKGWRCIHHTAEQACPTAWSVYHSEQTLRVGVDT